MRSLDSGAEAFRKTEDRLQRLTLPPSEYVRRQVRVTPYPHEPAGWIVRNTGPEIAMFSSDYPHIEGGRHPLRRFDTSLAECSDAERRAFYCDNFVDFMGARLAAP
jgi:predicted TIM-barrel fold metal-dependent hydrolase